MSARSDGWDHHLAAAMLVAMLLAGMGLAWYAPDHATSDPAGTAATATPDPTGEALSASPLLADTLPRPETRRGDSPGHGVTAPATLPPVAATPPDEGPEPELDTPTEPSADGADGTADGAVASDEAAGDTAAADEAPGETATLELDAELAEALTATIASSELDEEVSVAVVAADGEVVFDHRADQLRMPASSAKLITAAAVVEAFGVDHRLTTEAIGHGQVESGVVDGDLVIVGGGDPALAHPDFEQVLARWPRTRLEDLADRIAAAVDRVTGDVVADAHAWPREPTAAGWPQRYLDRGYARHMSALMVNAGTEIVERDSGTLAIPVTDPAAEAAAALLALLEEREVAVDGEAIRRDGPVDGVPIATVDSHRLDVVMAEMLRRSDNVLADGLWRAAGAAQGAGSWSGAARWGRTLLGQAGADTDDVVLADGSGLSRDSRVAAAHLAKLDAAMARGEHAVAWAELMDKAGDAAHLRRRLAGGDAHGAVRAKTGTLRDVRSLAGHVVGDEGRWHFAVLADGMAGGQPWQATALTDQLVELLARHAKGCELAGCSVR